MDEAKGRTIEMARYPYTKCCVAGRFHPSPGKPVECDNCGKPNPEHVQIPRFSPPNEVELVIRRWKDGDATIDHVFEGIQEYARSDFWQFIKSIRPDRHDRTKEDSV